MDFKGCRLRKEDYCQCTTRKSITLYTVEEGYWDICCQCKRPIECGFHYYNHYDGEDHEEDIY